jgi:hypothetical protein
MSVQTASGKTADIVPEPMKTANGSTRHDEGELKKWI